MISNRIAIVQIVKHLPQAKHGQSSVFFSAANVFERRTGPLKHRVERSRCEPCIADTVCQAAVNIVAIGAFIGAHSRPYELRRAERADAEGSTIAMAAAASQDCDQFSTVCSIPAGLPTKTTVIAFGSSNLCATRAMSSLVTASILALRVLI